MSQAQQPIPDSAAWPYHNSDSDRVPNSANSPAPATEHVHHDDSVDDGFCFIDETGNDIGNHDDLCGMGGLGEQWEDVPVDGGGCDEDEGGGMGSSPDTGVAEDASDQYPFDSTSELPECFKGHNSVISLVKASEEFGSKHGFAVQVKGIIYFKKTELPTGVAPNATSAADPSHTHGTKDAQSSETTSSEHTSAALARMSYGHIRCHHYGIKRPHKPAVGPVTQRQKRSVKLGCNFHIVFKVAVEGGSPEVGFPSKTGAANYDMAHAGHECKPAHERYINREFSEEEKTVINSFVAANGQLRFIRRYLRQTFPQSNFTNKDLSNYVQKIKGDSSKDAQGLLASLFEQQKTDPNMTVRIKQDVDGALKVRKYHNRRVLSFTILTSYPLILSRLGFVHFILGV